MCMIKKEYITIPNTLTFSRLIGSIVLIFLKPMSASFLIVYSLAGLTDAFDGYLARKMKLESEFGSKLDSVSDLSFYTIMMIKILPILFVRLNVVIWNWVFGVVFFRILTYICNAIKHKGFLSSHTFLNKATGLGVFGIPYITFTNILEPFCWMVVGIALVAAIYEFMYSLLRKGRHAL